MPKRTRKQAGKLAVQHGRFVERIFDASGVQYRLDRTALVQAHFPEYRPGPSARFQAPGLPDRSVFLPGIGLALVEIKYVTNVNQVTFSERFHQFTTMQDDVAHYGDDVVAGAYFIYWERQNEFRLHDHRTMKPNHLKQSLTVTRSDGKKLKEKGGLVHWLQPLAGCFLAPLFTIHR